ncbi:ABC transporter substrate-binding protein [candidate division KSB1 bacterium]
MGRPDLFPVVGGEPDGLLSGWFHLHQKVNMRLSDLISKSRGRLRFICLLCLTMSVGLTGQSQAIRYKVGLLAPLSGDKAPLGLSVLNGAVLALETFNRNNSDQVDLVRFDSQGDIATAVRGARHLCDLEGVWAIIGPLGNSSAMSAAGYCQVRGVTMISPTATLPSLASLGPAIFRLNYTTEYQGRIIGEYAVTQLGYSNYAVLYPETNYGRGFMKGFVDRITELGAVIVAMETYKAGTTDFQEPLERIRELTPEALFVPASPQDIILIAPQIGYMRLIAQILGNSNWCSEFVLSESGLYVEDAVFSLDHIPGSENGPGREFIRKYRDRFAEDPFVPWAMLGYDAMQVVLLGLKDKPPSRALMPDALAKIENYNGVSGYLRSFQEGEPDKLMMIGTVKLGTVLAMNEELADEARIRGEEMARLRQIEADSLWLPADSLALEIDSPQLTPEEIPNSLFPPPDTTASEENVE